MEEDLISRPWFADITRALSAIGWVQYARLWRVIQWFQLGNNMDACRWVRYRMETTLRTVYDALFLCNVRSHSCRLIWKSRFAITRASSLGWHNKIDVRWPTLLLVTAFPTHPTASSMTSSWSRQCSTFSSIGSPDRFRMKSSLADGPPAQLWWRAHALWTSGSLWFPWWHPTDTVEGWPLRSCSPPGSLQQLHLWGRMDKGIHIWERIKAEHFFARFPG